VTTLQSISDDLKRAFPANTFQGTAATHDCLECDEIRRYLRGKSWPEVDELHLFEIPLPLLTPEGYRAFLPAWLWQGLHDPEGSPAALALINLAESNHMGVFAHSERAVVVRCAEFIHASDPFASQDEESVDRLQKIQDRWHP
jgi:hypothetical protein